jgi:hypothetical protein
MREMLRVMVTLVVAKVVVYHVGMLRKVWNRIWLKEGHLPLPQIT